MKSKLENNIIFCSSNNKETKRLFYIVFSITLVVFMLFCYRLKSYWQLHFTIIPFLKNCLWPFFENYDTYLLLLFIILSIVCFLRIKNFYLIIKDDQITYINIWGSKFEYDICDVIYYKKPTVDGVTSIMIKVKRKHIWISRFDTNLSEFENYLQAKNIKHK